MDKQLLEKSTELMLFFAKVEYEFLVTNKSHADSIERLTVQDLLCRYGKHDPTSNSQKMDTQVLLERLCSVNFQ